MSEIWTGGDAAEKDHYASKERDGNWMQTYTGKQFWPMDPRPEDVDILDIAHSLSLQCRYGGHSMRFYSVAEHSVLIYDHLRKNEWPADVCFYGLMHDAAEAYLSDVIRPVKYYLTGYKDIENRIHQCIVDSFGLLPEAPAVVKEYDSAILGDEKDQLTTKEPAAWFLPYPRLGVTIKGWDPMKAKYEFLLRVKLEGVDIDLLDLCA